MQTEDMDKDKTMTDDVDKVENEGTNEDKCEGAECSGHTDEGCTCGQDEEKSCNCHETECSDEKDTPESGDGNIDAGLLSKELEKAKKEAEEYRDKYTRLYAEFDNFRKRTDKEKSQMFEMGAKDVIEKLLPVTDNFERALDTVEEADKDDAFTKGVEGIYKQIQKMFTELDIKPIEALGQKFDANLHNAVMTDSEGDAEEDTITQDLQKGYTFRGQVVRHSMVKVKK